MDYLPALYSDEEIRECYLHSPFYQACAPFWLDTGADNRDSPVGLCAFSAQKLRDFQYTKPCSEQT